MERRGATILRANGGRVGTRVRSSDERSVRLEVVRVRKLSSGGCAVNFYRIPY